MHIKRLEIYGFKSFPYKVVIPFSKGITAIVGPNGSGKSNILDAIKWVLGEQSPKRLRVRDLSDLIFSGNSDKKIDFAEVKLILSHDPPVFEKFKDLDEIVIIRRFYRDGEGEFYINNRACRLKDIHFLFLDLGINPQGYSIIDQGEINKFLEVSPKERKIFLEDLAGVTKLKVTEEEALKNLLSTEHNLVRLTDILKEVESQYYHLKEQAEVARRYLALREELKDYTLKHLRLLFKRALERKKGLLEKINERKLKISEQERHLEKLEDEEREIYKEILNLERQTKDIKRERAEKEEELKKREEALGNLYKEESKINHRLEQEKMKESSEKQRKDLLLKQLELNEQEIKVRSEKIEDLVASLREIKTKREELLKDLSERQRERQKLNSQFDSLKREGIRLREKREFLEKELNLISKETSLKEDEIKQLELSQRKLTEDKIILEKTIAKKREEKEDLEREISHLQASAEELRSNIEGLQKKKGELNTEKRALEEKLRLLSQILESEERGLDPQLLERTLGNLLRVSPEEMTLLENYYKDLLKAIVIKDLKEVEILIKREKGNLIFIVESALADLPLALKILDSGEYLPESASKELIFLKDKNLLISPTGFIFYLRDTKKGYFSLKKEKEVFEKALAEINVRLSELEANVGTLKERFKATEKAIEERERKKREKEEEIQRINLTITQFEQRKIRLEENLKGLRENLENLSRKKSHLEKEKIELEEKIKDLTQRETEFSELTKGLTEGIRDLEGRKNDLERKLSEIEKDLIKNRTERDQLVKRRQEIASEVEAIERFLKNSKHTYEILLNEVTYLREKILKEKGKKEALKETLKILEEKATSLESELTEKNSHLRGLLDRKRQIDREKNSLIQSLHSLELDLTETNLHLENLKKELIEITGSEETLENLSQDGDDNLDLKMIEARIEEIKKELRTFQEVNLASLKEFDNIAERYETLLTQKRDLESALEHLKKILRELRAKAEKQLLETLKNVNAKLREIFPLIMEKGTAELYLTNDEPLKAGLELKISSPYKNIKHLHMLSGGEKALCVIAILIAFYLTRPGPFCILDEVDAPLDEKNSLNFINLMQKIKENSQIILITHNLQVMKEVDHLIGVTMEEKGVSKLVKLKLTESQAKI